MVSVRTAMMLALLASAYACGPAGTRAPDGGRRGDASAPAAGSHLFLNRLWGAAPDDVWAVGDEGVIVHFNGVAWRRVPSPTTANLHSIAGRGPGDALAVGAKHTILRLRGTTWMREEPLPAGDASAMASATDFYDVWMAANGEAWVAGALTRDASGDAVESCVLAHHEDGRWTFDRDDGCARLDALWGTGPGDVWARGPGDAVVHWDGRSLTKHPKKAPPPRRGRHGFAGGWRRSSVGFITHPHHPTPPTTGAYADLWAFGPDDVWVVQGGVGPLHFDGRAWTIAPILPP
jgi:hypothetical protein